MQNQASSNIFHMHLAKQPSLQPGSSWRSANILTRYKEAHTRNSFSPAPEENWNENYVIMDWLKEAYQPEYQDPYSSYISPYIFYDKQWTLKRS